MNKQEKMEFYGADAVEWLRRWDAGESVWSVEMGGLGPAYEQCIQIAAAEMIRFLIDGAYDALDFDDDARRAVLCDKLSSAMEQNEAVSRLGLSGAQFGAARNIAAIFYRQGPAKAMMDEEIKDRLIQVSRHFPGA